MADDYFAILAYDHRVVCGFYDHEPLDPWRTVPTTTTPSNTDDSVPYFDIDDDEIII